MILKNISILYGNDLKFIEKTSVRINGNTFQKIASKIKPAKNKVVNCDGLLLIPGLINSHTHIGDSIAKDVALDKDPDSKIRRVLVDGMNHEPTLAWMAFCEKDEEGNVITANEPDALIRRKARMKANRAKKRSDYHALYHADKK